MWLITNYLMISPELKNAYKLFQLRGLLLLYFGPATSSPPLRRRAGRLRAEIPPLPMAKGT